ncbi:hypothetical protein [Pseudomonas sp. W2-17]|uniref:hypothetical protein n=1 Tax=Pseudomonas sp. W2-17 TaxID=3058039 RepID=UPI0034E09890
MPSGSDTKVFIDRNLRFGAFWRDPCGDLILFDPRSAERLFKADLTRWNDHRQQLVHPEDKHYDDDLLCAAYDFSLGGIYVNKDTVQRLTLPLGSYYPRVWRGIPSKGFMEGYVSRAPTVAEHSAKLQSTVAATSLFQELEGLFRYIEPDPNNAAAYGHKIRELLILACTEVEASWRGVIVANCSEIKCSTLTTRDYVKLLPLLRLDQWSVRLKNYFSYETICPFEGWTSDRPTKSLSWYDAYNAVKHDREGNFSKASIEHLLQAMAAVHVLQMAQWGPDIYSEIFQSNFSPFRVIKTPTLSVSDMYVCPPGYKSEAVLYFD